MREPFVKQRISLKNLFYSIRHWRNHRNYYLTKIKYCGFVEPLFKSDFQPKIIYTCCLILPFYLSISDNYVFHSYEDESSLFGVIFRKIRTKKLVHPNIVKDIITFEQNQRSQVEIFLVSSNENRFQPKDIIQSLLAFLNNTLRAYSASSKDCEVHPIPPEMVLGNVMLRIIEPNKWKYLCKPTMVIQLEKLTEKKKASEYTLERVHDYYEMIRNKSNPFVNSELMWLDAKREFLSGYLRDAVIHCQTCIEMFLASLYIQLRTVEGISGQAAEGELENAEFNFIRMVKREFHNRIGGQWDINSSSSVVGQWYKSLYQLRNSVVHAGHMPNNYEAKRAMEAAIVLRLYIIDLVNKAEFRYRELGKYFDKCLNEIRFPGTYTSLI